MIQQIFNFKLFKNDKIWEDDAKKSLLASKIILNLLKFWPENFNKSTKISFATITTIYVLIQFSLLVYLVTGIDDVASLTRTMSVFVLGMQIMVKMSILFFRSQDLNDILKTVRYEFWPSDISGYELQIKIKSQTDTLLYTCLLMYLGATYFLLLIALTPLINGVRELPYITWYPFNWAQSPTYEIVYVLEGCLNILNGAIVCCTDFLYYALCANCTAQFQLLCDILKQIGRGGEKELSRNLLRIPGVTYEPVFNKEYEDERKLMVLCIKHHQKILNICSKLIKIFEFGHFYQLVASVGGLGAVCFLITISQKLAEDAFQCLWYNRKYRDIRQCLSIMIMRSQKPISTKALGLFELSYASFVSVMRFTFSLYTFLDTFSEK